MKLVELTILVLGINAAIDEHPSGATIEEAREHIRAGDILDWLKNDFGVDVSLIASRPTSAKEYVQGLQSLLGGYEGSERRKWGVSKNGLCLVLAWTNEMIQQRDWTD